MSQSDYFSQTRSEMLQFVPKDARCFLDIGCGEAVFSAQLKSPETAVWGIELDEKSALIAAAKIDKVLTGDINRNIDLLPNNYFDCVVFNDVLEHLQDPYDVLKRIKSKLSSKGVVVASIPNVRYITNLKHLLIDKQWKYEDYGILDRTHLRFFTQKSIIDMFNELDYDLIKIEGINPVLNWKFSVLNVLSLGLLYDSRYLQFACVAKPK